MFKKMMLSMLMVSGSLCALDDAAGATNLLKESNNTEDATEQPKGMNADFVRAFFDLSKDALKNGYNAAKEFVQGQMSQEVVVPTKSDLKDVVEELITDTEPLILNVSKSSDVPMIIENVTIETEEPVVRFAAIRTAWNSHTMKFACDMFNPYAHGRAWKAMWNAGFKAALPTLWQEHSAVIAGTAVVATVAAVYFAHKKGLIEQAKTRIADFKNQYLVSPA